MSRVLPRFLPDDSEEWEAKLARIIATTGDRETKPKRGQKQQSLVGFRSSEADRDRLRAIPVQCVEGVGGTIPDTNPLYALLNKENEKKGRR